MNYRKKNERYLYSLCIRENLRNFEIKKKDGELIPYIYITYKLEEIKNRYFVDFRAVLELVNITAEELGLDPDKIHSNGYIFNKSKMIKLRMPIITQHEINIYRFLDDKVNKKEVILFQYEPFLKIGKNKFFGEASFSGKGVRNGTARIVEDCYFGYIDIQLYNINFYEEKKAIFEKKVNFLYSNFFFSKISIRKFETHFFNWFISEEYKNNDLIYKENDPCQFIYFIEEGAIELTSSRTILEIQLLLENLEERRLSMKEKGEKKDYNNLNNDWFDLENHVNKNQINKILISGKNNILGLESFYYQLPFITNARVITPKAKLVKIDIEHLYQILIRSSECMHELEIKVRNIIKILTNRFFSLNNVKLMLIDNKITREENLQYENHIKEKKKELKLRINSPTLDKKCEIVKKNEINKEIERRKNKLNSAMVRAVSTSNLTNFWDEYFEKYNNKDKNKENKEKNKKRVFLIFYII
jgi:CRP-like cAMP-binding protein